MMSFKTKCNDGSPEGTVSPEPAATPKWPLRPGVLVHVNTNHSLSLGRLGLGADPQGSSDRRATSLTSVIAESQHTRAQRIRNMFSDQRKFSCSTMPGVYHGKSGGKGISTINRWRHSTTRQGLRVIPIDYRNKLNEIDNNIQNY